VGQASHRLTQINRTGATADALNANFTYDAYGRRIQTSIASGGQPPQTVQYLYEGSQALGEIRGGTLTHRLLTGLSLDETIARIAINTTGNKDAANSRIYLTDALNSALLQQPGSTGRRARDCRHRHQQLRLQPLRRIQHRGARCGVG
jgi:hypothetical protein